MIWMITMASFPRLPFLHDQSRQSGRSPRLPFLDFLPLAAFPPLPQTPPPPPIPRPNPAPIPTPILLLSFASSSSPSKDEMEAKEKGETLPAMESSSSMPPPLCPLASRTGPPSSFPAMSPDIFNSGDPRHRPTHGAVLPPADPLLGPLSWPLRPTHGLLLARFNHPSITAAYNSSQATQTIHSALYRASKFYDA